MGEKSVPDRVNQKAEASDHAQINQSGGDQYIHNYGAGSGPAPKALDALPGASARLVGRDADMRAVLDTLNPESLEPSTVPRVVAVSGLPGVGKTALALDGARRAVAAGWFPGGTLFIPLRGYDPAGHVSGEQAVGALLRALGVRDADLPPTPDEQVGLYRSELTRRADEKGPVLLVADDASTAAQIRPLLPSGRGHRLLFTSRHTLASVSARLIQLGTLDPGPAADLITNTLTRARPHDPRPGSERRALVEVVGHCGCLPLALEIAAAILVADPGLPLSVLAAELAQSRLEALYYEEEGHSRAVRAAFDLSYRRLPDAQACAFRLLSLNPGPDVSTAAATALIGRLARPLLAALARASLISEEPVGADRWRMHDLIRLYATQLAQDGDNVEREEALDRLLEHYQITTGAAAAHLGAVPGAPVSERFHDITDALAWLDAERPNLVAAVTLATATGRPYIATSLARHLGVYLTRRRHFDDAINAGQRALTAARTTGDRHGEGIALNILGLALREMRRFEEAITVRTEAAAIFVETGDRRAEGIALNGLGVTLEEMGRFEEAIPKYTQAITLAIEAGDRHDEGGALENLGSALRKVGRFEEAITKHTQAAAIAVENRDRLREGGALDNLGLVLREVGRFEEAMEAHSRAITLFVETGDRHDEGGALDNLGLVLQEVGRFEEAMEAHSRAITLFVETGDHHREATVLDNLANARAGMEQAGRFRGLWRAAGKGRSRRKPPSATDPT